MTELVALAVLAGAAVTVRLRRDLRRATTWTYDMPCAWWTNGHGARRTDEQLYRHAMPLPETEGTRE